MPKGGKEKGMGLIATLEKWLEKTVEGFFNKGFSGQIQPIEIAKRLVKEMERNKTVSISKVYVPNYYLVYLSQQDYEKIKVFQQALAQELGEYLLNQGLKAKYIFLREPSIDFSLDDNLSLGQIRLEGRFIDENNLGSDSKQLGNTEEITDTKMQPVVPQTTQMFSSKNLVGEMHAELVVLEGPDKGKKFLLSQNEVIIGRKNTNQVALNDSNISRCHAKIEHKNGNYTVLDLGSTNGTLVNGSLIKEKLLKHDDNIELGTTVLLFRVV